MRAKQDGRKIPNHIAVIMDGNGRWATQKGAMRSFGHRSGVQAVREITEGCSELGVDYLTLYAFSTENWSRPQKEIDGLMSLLIKTIEIELSTLMKNKIRLTAIGDLKGLSMGVHKKLLGAIDITSKNKGLNLILALNYSGKWDLTQACKSICGEAIKGTIKPEAIDENLLSDYLSTKRIPDPALLIRTSGEMRISNFLLWQLAYTEFFFTEILWPDFRKKHLNQAIDSFNRRERRFGKTSEQLDLK